MQVVLDGWISVHKSFLKERLVDKTGSAQSICFSVDHCPPEIPVVRLLTSFLFPLM